MAKAKMNVRTKIGDHIKFKRNEREIQGIVELGNENSVIVGIDEDSANQLNYATNRTVVKHSNYIIINNHETA